MSLHPIKNILESHPSKDIADEFMIEKLSGLDRNQQLDIMTYLLYCVCRSNNVSTSHIAEAADDYARFDRTLS